MLSSCTKKATASHPAHPLKAENFHTFIENSGTLNVVDFSATWCGPCQQLKPILAQIADEHSDVIRLGVIDVDDENSFSGQQGVRGIPDVRFYINGKMVDKFTGSVPKEYIEQIIAKHSQNLTPVDDTAVTNESNEKIDTTLQPPKANLLPPGMSKE
jgi:thioredoxin